MDNSNGGDSKPGPVERLYTATFAKRLRDLRMTKNMSKSDLAKKIWGTTTDARGYEVAKHRARITVWENGEQTPTQENLGALAQALEVSVADLAPDLLAARGPDTKKPAILMSMVDGHPGIAMLVINTQTSLKTASKIIDLLSADPITSAALA